jgi:holo-[acyl-carrier protein] synthase
MVSADFVLESISRHGDHYLQRVFSEREVLDCSTATAIDAERLAARFAAKEATFKVLRVGDEAVGWRDVEVRRHSSGWVDVSLMGQAAALAEIAGITDLSLSLTHERGYAAAVVIAEIEKPVET